ncbi:protein DETOXIFICATION 12-like [Bidens hawaiensis]|uniref:protein DETOXIFICATION 12-like n=1 Tax=Bidens hawaiensis TaxID=980011 RepID=UPI004049501C
MGMVSALETLCGQAYGAQQYNKFGTQVYTAILSLLLVCIPLSILCNYTEHILVLTGQNRLISHETGKFITWLIPSLFASAILQPLNKYFQMQTMLLPMLVSSTAVLCLHVPVCWFLVHKTGLKSVGAAISVDITMWLDAVFLSVYMKYSSACEATRGSVSVEVLYGIKDFFRYAVPSAVMMCSLLSGMHFLFWQINILQKKYESEEYWD